MSILNHTLSMTMTITDYVPVGGGRMTVTTLTLHTVDNSDVGAVGVTVLLRVFPALERRTQHTRPVLLALTGARLHKHTMGGNG